ncbi:Hint domain-containing protein, partial [Parafrankia sp. FMc2]|uniref:Hint domain-containing protein n=1 Tax=Parafrankia sp. FMc2 TaxID=3233196 RepID=UPI0034D6B117
PQCKAPLRCIGDTPKPVNQTRDRITQETRDQLEDALDREPSNPDCASTQPGTTPLADTCQPQRPDHTESCTLDNSFDGDTPVLLADGTTTPIRNIKIGDRVLATNPDTGRTEPHTVTHLIVGTGDKHLVDITVDTRDGPAVLTATGGHPFWDTTDREWVDADDLTPSDTLRTPDGHTVSVAGTREYQQHDTVYNLTVDTLHTYYVLAGTTPALVHNASCRTVVENQAGRFGDLDPGIPGDGLTPHHMPQAALNFLPSREGGAIVMRQSDHILTRTYGPRGRATRAAESNLSFREVLARDIWDMRRIGQSRHGDPSYFNPGIRGLLSYYRRIGIM